MVKILILGGGFGGIRCALDLERRLSIGLANNEIEITLLDKNGHHLFVPALYEVASAYNLEKDPFAVKIKKTICIPYADIFERKKINYIQAEIAGVDLENKKIITRGGNELAYDYLVFALGSQTTNFGIPGVAEYAYQFKGLDDALMINEKINSLLEEISKGKRTVPVRVLIVGAGLTGIELGAEISCCMKNIARKCRLGPGCTMITLFEAGPKILPMASEQERKIIKDRLTRLNIMIMENSQIEEVELDRVKLKDGRTIHGDMIVWTAGIEANRALREIKNLKLDAKGKIAVNENLTAEGYQNVFAIGDNAGFIDTTVHKPVPAMAFVAGAEGKIAAQNISNMIKNKPYRPFYDLWVAPVGGKFSLAHLWWGIRIKGFWGWIVRELVDLKYLLSILPIKKAIRIFWEETTVFTKND